MDILTTLKIGTKMDANKLERKQIAKEIDNIIQSGFNIDDSHDEELLQSSNYTWDDLDKLKTDLGNQIIEFIGMVNTVITNQAIISNLGDKTKHFDKTVSLFFSDINNFSLKIRDIRVQHEGKTGHINNLNEFNQYNRIAIQYQSLFSELTTLISPILADIMMTIADIVPVKVDEAVNDPQQQEGAANE